MPVYAHSNIIASQNNQADMEDQIIGNAKDRTLTKILTYTKLRKTNHTKQVLRRVRRRKIIPFKMNFGARRRGGR